MPPSQCWLAKAPSGLWDTGPLVAYTEEAALEYREMGWQVEGPFVLVPVGRVVDLSAVEDFLRFAWEAYTRDAGHAPGWDWRARSDVLRQQLRGAAEQDQYESAASREAHAATQVGASADATTEGAPGLSRRPREEDAR